MEKNMIIKGVTCPHCNVRVENALNSVDGVKARVNAGAKCALVDCNDNITNADLIRAVQNAGYTVEKIETIHE